MDYLISFALEIFQYNQKTGLLEQYNLNDEAQKYKTLYAYNVETGEEFSYHTQTFMRVPANFKGWIRIPFSQYAAPAWSMASDYGNEGVLDFDANPVVKISITRLFNPNQDTTVILDDIALYYSDFGVGSLFDTDKPYLDENITVGEIAKKLYTNKAYLSRVINDHTGKNFCQYVNYYRVMYSIQAFKENPGLRVYELAEMSGFHTIVSYNMAFRLVTNETPSEWCKRVRSETDVKGVRRV